VNNVYNRVCYTRKKQRRLRALKYSKLNINLTVNCKPLIEAMNKLTKTMYDFGVWFSHKWVDAMQTFDIPKPSKTRLIKPYLGNQGNPYFYKTTIELNLKED
jgi:hypothetical protein